VLLVWSTAAFAFQPPNTWFGVTAGASPAGVVFGARGEAWLYDEVSVELGAATDADLDALHADLAFRWRPDGLCFGCDGRTQVTFGVGLAGFTTPDLQLDGPWAWAVGPDLVGTFVQWLGPAQGLTVSLRGGGGAAAVGDPRDSALEPTGWVFGSVGLAF
jgi:hypothetical protein